MINSIQSFACDCTSTIIKEEAFHQDSSDSEVDVPELPENLEKMFPRYYINGC